MVGAEGGGGRQVRFSHSCMAASGLGHMVAHWVCMSSKRHNGAFVCKQTGGVLVLGETMAKGEVCDDPQLRTA